MTNGLEILAQTIITGNLILVQGLGLYALTRFTRNVQDAVWTGLTTLVGMLVGGVLLWVFQGVQPSSLAVEVGYYLVVGTVAALVTHRLLKRRIVVEDTFMDSALVGFILLMGRDGITGVHNLWFALGGGVGYCLTLVVMATLRQRLEMAPVPKALRGTPILLITAGLLAIALLGFRL